MDRLLGLAVCGLLGGCSGQGRDPDPYDLDFDIPRTERFSPTLSDYGLYEEPLADRQPSERAIPFELSSDLFTDYAKKQRLVMVPEGTAITLVDDETWAFPEGTVLAKTFYYPLDMRDSSGPARVIETRLLVKTEGVWNVATYLWNAEQTEATLLLDGTTTEVSWLDEAGEPRSTEYAVPHEGECVTCHQSGGVTTFVGPTVVNLNRSVTHNADEVNQLAFLQDRSVLEDGDLSFVASVPNYRDVNRSLESRARAYLDINCAHCHNPDGWDEASQRDIDFRYTTPLGRTGLDRQADELERLLKDGEMPFLGTTLLHTEGIELLLDYVDTL